MKFYWLVLILLPNLLHATEESTNKMKVEVIYQEIKNSYKDVPEITISNLKKIPKDNLIIVDVREDAERAISIIPGAINLTHFKKVVIKRKTVVAYCTIGYRSAEFVRSLRKKGIKAFNLEGSILGWVHANELVVNPEGKTINRVHVYGQRWNLLPLHYEGTW